MFNIYTYNIQKLKLQSYRGVCHLKGSAGDNRLWKTSMHEAAGATKQRQISTQVWAGEWCHLSEPHLQSAAILSAPLPAPLHLWKCILHHEGSPKSSYMIRTRHGVCNQPRTRLRVPFPPPHDRNKVSSSALGAGLWAHGAMLDGCSTLSSMSILLSLPTPLFLLFPCSHLLIRFSASAEWVKHNYHTYVRGKKVEYKVIKEKT